MLHYSIVHFTVALQHTVTKAQHVLRCLISSCVPGIRRCKDVTVDKDDKRDEMGRAGERGRWCSTTYVIHKKVVFIVIVVFTHGCVRKNDLTFPSEQPAECGNTSVDIPWLLLFSSQTC